MIDIELLFLAENLFIMLNFSYIFVSFFLMKLNYFFFF